MDEYQRLLERYEEIKAGAEFAYRPESAQAIAKTKTLAVDATSKAFMDLKSDLSTRLSECGEVLAQNLQGMQQRVADSLATFGDVQQAIEASQKQLELQHHIQVAAGTLAQLIQDYEQKNQELERAHAARIAELDAAIAVKRRDWQREQEDYEYTNQLSRRRQQALLDEETSKREEALRAREEALRAQETEVAELRKRVQNFPEELNRDLGKRMQEASREIEREWKDKFDALQKDRTGEKHLLELRIKFLEDQLKRAESENARLKGETELAQQKAQELAVKVIETNVGGKEAASARPTTSDRAY